MAIENMTPPVRRYQSAEETAGLIWDVLVEYARSGITRREIEKEADLTPTQFQHGMAYLRDLFQTDHEQPVHYDPKVRRYYLTNGEAEARVYLRWLAKRLQSHTRRTGKFMEALDLKLGTAATHRLTDSWERVVKDVEYVLADLSA